MCIHSGAFLCIFVPKSHPSISGWLFILKKLSRTNKGTILNIEKAEVRKNGSIEYAHYRSDYDSRI